MTKNISHGSVEVEFMTVTPQLAQKWLEHHNNRNRRMKRKTTQLARDMSEGNWTLNGDTIRFDVEGELIDGQHRLAALIESGTEQTFIVVSGLPSGVQDSIDLGTKRTMGDQLTLAGYKNATLMGAVLGQLVPMLKHGYDWSRNSTELRATHAEMRQFLESHRTRVEAAVHVGSVANSHHIPGSASSVGVAYYLAARKSKADADVFFLDHFIEQVDVRRGHPAKALMTRFANMRQQGVKITQQDTVRYCLKAWNHWRDGESVDKIQAPKGGWNSTNFPVPK